MNKVYLATRSERVGHWINAGGFVLLVLSGLNIHFAREFDFFGSLAAAVAVHELTGVVVSINYLFWWIYMVGSRRIRFYVPGRDDLLAGVVRQGRYYLLGIFRGAPHPFEEGEKRKFNPLQKWTYLGVMTVLLPVQAITGIALFVVVHRWQDATSAQLRLLGVAHTGFAVLLTAFLLGHLYLATTGPTPWAHFRMMFTGWADAHATAPVGDQGADR